MKNRVMSFDDFLKRMDENQRAWVGSSARALYESLVDHPDPKIRKLVLVEEPCTDC